MATRASHGAITAAITAAGSAAGLVLLQLVLGDLEVGPILLESGSGLIQQGMIVGDNCCWCRWNAELTWGRIGAVETHSPIPFDCLSMR